MLYSGDMSGSASVLIYTATNDHQMFVMYHMVTLKRNEFWSQLVRFKPDFVKDRVKEIYSEIWGLDVSADGNTVFTAWNNSILVSDLGSFNA